MMSSDAIMDEDAIIQMSLDSNDIYGIYDAFTDDTDTLRNGNGLKPLKANTIRMRNTISFSRMIHLIHGN